MKLSQKTSTLEFGGALEDPVDFKIVASKSAFKILSSGLYNDKILAIIRELSCNAYDAHVAAGKKDQPFELHLPTAFEPYFSVKDDGVGLSHEEIFSLYTTYFATDKSESNEFVGVLGLGSKSPFCYTDENEEPVGFTVVSRFNGETRTYAAAIGESSTPKIICQMEEDTPEACNGLEVQFPVRLTDCNEFVNKAQKALEFFDPLPKMNVEIRVDKKDYIIRTDHWGSKKRL